MNKILTTLVISVFILTACNSGSKKTSKQSEIVIADSISFYENILFGGNSKTIKPEDALKLAGFYGQYAAKNQTDSISPLYLFKAADIYSNFHHPKEAISAYKTIIEKYPESDNKPTAIFLTAFVYEDQLQDYANAEIYYKLYLEKYPDSDFADDAEISIENLGKTPEQLIKEFESKNQ